MNVQELSLNNPYIDFCCRWHLTKSARETITHKQLFEAKVSGAVWFAFKEQAILWSMVLAPRKFTLQAVAAGSAGFALGAIKEWVCPGKRKPAEQWAQWFETDAVLKTPIKLTFKGISATATVLHVLLTLIFEKDFRTFNALRFAMFSYYLGRHSLNRSFPT